MMWIGTLALIGFPGFAGFFSKDAILESAYASHNPFHLYAFWCGILAAVLTAFYSGRLIWLTFHGEPRADHETMHHVHESPPVMTVPLMVLAVGRGARGLARLGHGRRRGRFLGRGDLLRRAQPRPARHARGAVLGEAGAVPRDGDRPGLLLGLLHAAAGPAGRRSPAMAGPVNRLFYNKWYFDELYDFLFVRPAKALGYGALARRRVGIIDRFGPDGVAVLTLDTVRAGGAAADRLRLPLRLRHADRGRGPGQLVPLRDCRVSSWATGRYSPWSRSCRWWAWRSSCLSAASRTSWPATAAAWPCGPRW